MSSDKPRIIVGCEYSQIVTNAFRNLGYEAYSCDILDTEGNPQWHIKDNVLDVIAENHFDLGIFHPPCTYLCNSGVRWLYNSDGSKNNSRWDNMIHSAQFFKYLWNADIDKIAIENPIMHKYAKQIIGVNYTQKIQPWQFGHGESKATCLWLKNLPPLEPTDIVSGRVQRIHLMSPGTRRGLERSRTYQGIANAMATQWSKVL